MHPRAALREFSLKNIDVHRLVRALVEHDGWLVPATFLADAFGVEAFEDLTVFGDDTAIPEGEVWLFSDGESALRAVAAGGSVGPCEGGLSGCDLFASWSPELGTVEFNPGSPAEESLTLQADGTDLLTMWANVVRLERAFAANPKVDDEDLHTELFAFEDFLVLVDTGTNSPVFYRDRKYQRAMVVCTAPDNVDDFLDVFAGERGQFRTVTVAAPQLFAIMQQYSMDAVSFNPYANRPGAWVCPASIVDHLG